MASNWYIILAVVGSNGTIQPGFDSLCNIFIAERRERPYILNSHRNFRISEDELTTLVQLTKEFSDLNMVYEYGTIDTTTFDYPVAKIKYKFLNEQDSIVMLNLKNASFQLDTLISYTLHLIDKYDNMK